MKRKAKHDFARRTKHNFAFALGDKVRDSLTGYAGVVKCCSAWLTGCNTYGVQARMVDGKVPDTQFFDEVTLELVEEGPPVERVTRGGPAVQVPSTMDTP